MKDKYFDVELCYDKQKLRKALENIVELLIQDKIQAAIGELYKISEELQEVKTKIDLYF